MQKIDFTDGMKLRLVHANKESHSWGFRAGNSVTVTTKAFASDQPDNTVAVLNQHGMLAYVEPRHLLARYRTRSWMRVCGEDRDLDPGFAEHLRDAARPAQIAYQKLMGRHAGVPIGIECRSVSRDAWAFVLPDASSPCHFRVQYFDLDGFSGHAAHDTMLAAVEEMMGLGYRRIDSGALDRVASTARWALGVKRSAIMQRHQSGLIDWATCVAELSTLTERP
ncbi:hypothetical protein Cmtc_58850 [Cupriavidus sp. TKC]|uniref:hypothetical protein n=1 Tax=unclassified Cupriavidus TaxID=2640874 RepID=UPI000A92A7FF|nr:MULTISPECIES: hypothetical protein [unclassified Cupriavidus]GMG94665.1 hypothetical protein Cmtc_58850 [Cupriavidus sp. TKC]